MTGYVYNWSTYWISGKAFEHFWLILTLITAIHCKLRLPNLFHWVTQYMIHSLLSRYLPLIINWPPLFRISVNTKQKVRIQRFETFSRLEIFWCCLLNDKALWHQMPTDIWIRASRQLLLNIFTIYTKMIWILWHCKRIKLNCW